MPLIIVKLLAKDTKAGLIADIATYKAGAGSALATAQRGAAMAAVWDDNDQKTFFAAALAHGGLAIPASGNKTAALQHVVVEEDKLADAQTAVSAALAQVEHARVTDANTTVAGHVTSASAPFEAEDVGRIIEIAGVQKIITVRNSATDVSYGNTAGNFASGSGLTMKMLGAEVLQSLDLAIYKEPDGDYRYMLLMACEGEAY